MVQSQDSSDPSGVSHDGALDRTVPGRARARKANAAIQMRLAGAQWSEIAIALGYPTARTAMVATEKALEKQLQSEDRNALRRLAGARLERLLLSVWAKAVDPSHPEHLIASTKARELVGQYSKLFGLDAPTEIIVHSPSQNELEAWVAQVIHLRTPVVEEYDILEGEITDDPPTAIGG